MDSLTCQAQNVQHKRVVRLAMSVPSKQIVEWLSLNALPLWSQAGVDSEAGGFTEKLTLDGRPIFDCDKRLRVQTRQIYVYSHAHLLGWKPLTGCPDALTVASAGVKFLTEHFWSKDNRGFIFSTTRSGATADSRIEAYEQAFAIFALAWYHRATRDPAALEWAEIAIDAMDQNLADSEHGGFFENENRTSPRRQNPHMHYLEAMLAMHTASGNANYLARAHKIVELFCRRLLGANSGSLGEYFTLEWNRHPSELGNIVEPGHHFEWTWLLHQYSQASGQDIESEARTLYDFGEQYGVDYSFNPFSGLAIDSVSRTGVPIDKRKRLWVQTEAIKAQIARIEFEDNKTAHDRLEVLLTGVFEHYLSKGRGNWQDHLDEKGRAIATTAPASSFYHIFLCLTEVLRVRDRIQSLVI